jgi:hypothetical protein
MAFVQTGVVPGMTADEYDKIMEISHGGQPLEGELFHVAGPADDGWCVIDGWESREACDAAMQKYMSAFQEVGVSMEAMAPPKEFEIHHLEPR